MITIVKSIFKPSQKNRRLPSAVKNGSSDFVQTRNWAQQAKQTPPHQTESCAISHVSMWTIRTGHVPHPTGVQ